MKPIRSILFLTLSAISFQTQAETWSLQLPEGDDRDEAIQSAIHDLKETANGFGISFERGLQESHRIIVERSSDADGLSPQGFEMGTVVDDKGFKTITLRGGSLVGEVNGLYWIWDRLRVHGGIPDLNLRREPALSVRLAGGENMESIRNALRYGATWVTGGDNLKLVPWGVEPEDTDNEKHREEIKKHIDLAHSYHLKFLSGCDELTYLPEYLKEMQATLTPEDPNLWKALQEKYRRLFKALPELDGVVIRTGELTRVFGNYRPFDIIHEPTGLDWSLERRYRTFVQKMHEVVVAEFGKIYFQRTWETSAREHHSDPEIFKRTFTEEIPTEGLYLSPYMSIADRWYYQPYNPTFNLTRHNMVALLATLDYHAHQGIPVFPSFPGQYHQGGIQQVLSDPNSNLVGGQFMVPESDEWNVQNLTGYTLFRLSWDPNEDLWQIAHDFAAISLGREAAEEMAEAILLSYVAYQDGIYVKPVAESIQGNTLPHLRIGTFPVRGIPEIDRGREHIEWMQSVIYEPCRDRIDEALQYLDHGLEAARKIEEITTGAAPKMNETRRQAAIDSALLTRWLVETNVGYIRTCLAYFQFREDDSEEKREKLAAELQRLELARQPFMSAPGFRFQLFGIDQLIANVKASLEDPFAAEESLSEAPETDQVFVMIEKQQRTHREYFGKHPKDLLPILHWKGRIDGRDILTIQGTNLTRDHLQGDDADEEILEILNPLPDKEVTLVIEDFGSAPYGPFVLQHPKEENGYVGRIFLYDRDPSYGRWDFNVYAAPRSPKELGLELDW